MSISIILASSSETRKALLDRLQISYTAFSPQVDEKPNKEQHADDLARRLAYEKADIIAQQYPDALVIGSDQVAWYLDKPMGFIGKPKDKAHAIEQLQQHSGKTLCFSTALSVQCKNQAFETTLVEHYNVKFRSLSLQEIERYIEKDQPFYCAGSFKCESLGISLFESMHGHDQTTLMGLPMIQLCHILRKFGIKTP